MISNVHTSDGTSFNPREVLLAIRGYIASFFGCRKCADDFAQMTATVDTDVTQPQDGVLWLWRTHNVVGTALRSDVTQPQDGVLWLWCTRNFARTAMRSHSYIT